MGVEGRAGGEDMRRVGGGRGREGVGGGVWEASAAGAGAGGGQEGSLTAPIRARFPSPASGLEAGAAVGGTLGRALVLVSLVLFSFMADFVASASAVAPL